MTALSATQMQNAMSSIYAEMPWLNLGNYTGLFQGPYQVTLSGVSFMPLCVPMQAVPCTVQIPKVIWSSYLTEGGSQLSAPQPGGPGSLYRPCGPLIPVPQFPNNPNQLKDMIDPDLIPGGKTDVILIPQVVADVIYTFTPTFPLLSALFLHLLRISLLSRACWR